MQTQAYDGCLFCGGVRTSGHSCPEEILRFDGESYDPNLDEGRLGAQLGRVLALMQDGHWRTLDAIAAQTLAPPASVSARLRDLRKPRFGGYTVERQRMGDPKRGLFAYRLVKHDV